MCHQHSGVSFFSLVLVEFRGKNCSGEGSFLSSCFTFSDTKRPFLTQTHHTQQPAKTSRSPPYQSGFAIFHTMGRAAAPPNHGAAAPQHHTEPASCRGWALCRWFARLGGFGMRGRNLERGGGALTLGGGQLIGEYKSQPKVGSNVRGCDGKETWLGWNVWG